MTFSHSNFISQSGSEVTPLIISSTGGAQYSNGVYGMQPIFVILTSLLGPYSQKNLFFAMNS